MPSATLQTQLFTVNGSHLLLCSSSVNVFGEREMARPTCKLLTWAFAGPVLTFVMTSALALDEGDAKYLARENKCLNCHAVSKDGDGPAYHKVAEKFKNDPKAEEKLIHHITSGEKAKFPDGHEEAHKIVKTTPPNDQEQIKNLVHWILTR
jgi:cytochrome c